MEARTIYSFFHEVLDRVEECDVDFAIGGALAVGAHTGYHREPKDVDIICRPGDVSRFLVYLGDMGFRTEMRDSRWLGKAFKDGHYADFIFATVSGIAAVSDEWFARARKLRVMGREVSCLAPEELIYTKVYVQGRERYDGADINHVILKQGAGMDWKRLLGYMDQHWELFLSLIMNFIFVYPHDRHAVPNWVIEELCRRTSEAMLVDHRNGKICRGPLLSQRDYETDVQQWGYKSVTF